MGKVFQQATATHVKPMFSAYQSVSQSLRANTWTKLCFQTKEFDLTGAYDNVTNYRFQPDKAGYYQIDSLVTAGLNNTNSAALYKNGSIFKRGSVGYAPNRSFYASSMVACEVYLNGTSDYLEVYTYSQNAGNITAGLDLTYFQASYIANGV